MASFEFHKQHTIVDRPEYEASMDEYRRPRDPEGFDQMLVIHLDFRNFTKTALKLLRDDWEAFRFCMPLPLFAYCAKDEPDVAKWEAFVRLLGFEPVEGATIPGVGIDRRIFIHRFDKDSSPYVEVGDPNTVH